MKVNYLPINKDNIKKAPDSFITTIEKEEFIFKFSWNPEEEAFFFDLADYEGNPILLGRRLTYGQDMLDNVVDDRLPQVKIIPLDKTGVAEEEGINFTNLMKSVRPYIIVGDN